MPVTEAENRTNPLGQPIGEPVPGWTARPRPPRTPMLGRLCRIEPLDADQHADALFEAYAADREGRNWTYLPYGPFASAAEYRAFVESIQSGGDPLFFAIVDLATERPVGVASYLRIDPALGTIEVGHLCYAPALQRTPLSTEAMYLMMRRAFDELGYRRYEWKCDSRNAPSLAAAKRLGFQYEGVFRQAVVAKGRNRDTAWLSIIDGEWPALRAVFEAWLDPANFDASGSLREPRASLAPSLRSGAQRRRLEDFRRPAPERAAAGEAGRSITGHCLCGGVRIEVSGRVGPIVYCHCKRCQRANGSAFAANADVRAKYWKIAAGSELIREYESSPGIWRAFCGRCGSPVYSRRDDASDVFRVRLGLLDDDPGRRPLAHFWVESNAPWHAITGELPRFAKGPADHEQEIAALARSTPPSGVR